MYEAQSAQQAYRYRRASSVPVGKYTPELASELTEKLSQTWSPEQIAEKRRAESKPFVCFKAIYRWIYDRLLAAGDVRVLRHKGKRQKPVETRGKFMVGTPISKRPKEVRKHETFGHWELDTVVSSRGKSKACVATFIERKTRHYMALKNARSHRLFDGGSLWCGCKSTSSGCLSNCYRGSRERVCLLCQP